MRKALWTEWLREIQKSLPRFLSILFLVALGVAFFSGIRATEPDMQLSVDRQYDEQNFMDIRVISTQGLTNKDFLEIQRIKGVEEAEASYSKDVLCDIGQSEKAIKVYAQTEHLNQLSMTKGRQMKRSGECIVDTRFAEENDVKIGDTLTLKSGDDDKLEDFLKDSTYKIVGMADYNYYLTRNKGTTTIGNGKLSGFIVVPKNDFDMDVYTEIYITVKDAKDLTAYTDEYDDRIESVTDRIEDIKGEREEVRFQEVRNEALDKISAEEKKYNKQKKKVQKKLSDAKEKLDHAKTELNSGQKKLADSKKELDSGEKQLEAGRRDYENGIRELNSGKKEYQSGKKQYDQGLEDYKQQKQKLDQSKTSLDQAAAAYGLTCDQLTPEHGELYNQYQAYLAGKKELDAAKTKLDATKRELDAAKRRLDSSEQQLKKAKTTLSSSEKKLKDGKKEYEQGIKDLKKAKKEYQEGLAKYKKQKKKADTEFTKAEKKIQDAKEEVNDLKKGKWYVLDRNKIQSYVEFGQDSERIGAIGELFPLIFFLVAALVSLTTMTRMVEKERTQMGTMKALGYSKLQIAGKYLIYAVLATVLGSILGVIAGETVLPRIIIVAYCMMYTGVHGVAAPIHIGLGLKASGAAFISTIGATLFSCYRTLQEVPAQLMRPESPKEGKRVLLERIPFVWKRISFSWKSSIRNLLRYKKRFFMTIIGIGGCMSLLLVGFGLSNSIYAITDNQYKKLHIYDAMIDFDEEDEKLSEDMHTVLEKNEITSGIKVRNTSMSIENDQGSKTGYVIVPEDNSEINRYIKFQDRISGKTYRLEDDGVIITEKVAKMLDIEEGDQISLKEGDTKAVKVKVTAISENYLHHYVFMSKALYQKVYQKEPVYNELICNTKSKKDAFEKKLSENLLKQDGVNSVSFVSDTEGEMADMLGNLDIVVFVLVFSAGLLAFVVLYNLNNINIEERRRELATIKVLGFYQAELAAYVYRENVLLTMIGTFFGIFMGIALHRYVILTAEVDYIMFGREIFPQSYVFSILLTFLFAIIVNMVMYFKLKKIDMVESLKSVE
ncbi:MAG: ABC transporter permease [Lachnospiraceae bacterium]|nr:ABC transporter permease [Lachnospiraceae bacterium]